MLGKKSIYADEAYKGNFIGADWLPDIDLTDKVDEYWRDFNKKFIPIYLDHNPEKTKIAAGLACGMLHAFGKGLSIGDIVLCPNGRNQYYVGEIASDYQYVKDQILPHRRTVNWFNKPIIREDMSDDLKNSAASMVTVGNISKYSTEIDSLISGEKLNIISSHDSSIEDPSIFALEKHLEDFLVQNWQQTDLGKLYDIFEEDGQIVGQQYPSDAGPIDILAISKDKKEILVVELKRGRPSDSVIGQIQRYMGFVKTELAEPNQIVKGVIIAFEDDKKIHWALSVTNNIEFYTYKVSFKLEKK